jgi:vacuolar-type H+-ATPase subunit H
MPDPNQQRVLTFDDLLEEEPLGFDDLSQQEPSVLPSGADLMSGRSVTTPYWQQTQEARDAAFEGESQQQAMDVERDRRNRRPMPTERSERARVAGEFREPSVPQPGLGVLPEWAQYAPPFIPQTLLREAERGIRQSLPVPGNGYEPPTRLNAAGRYEFEDLAGQDVRGQAAALHADPSLGLVPAAMQAMSPDQAVPSTGGGYTASGEIVGPVTMRSQGELRGQRLDAAMRQNPQASMLGVAGSQLPSSAVGGSIANVVRGGHLAPIARAGLQAGQNLAELGTQTALEAYGRGSDVSEALTRLLTTPEGLATTGLSAGLGAVASRADTPEAVQAATTIRNRDLAQQAGGRATQAVMSPSDEANFARVREFLEQDGLPWHAGPQQTVDALGGIELRRNDVTGYMEPVREPVPGRPDEMANRMRPDTFLQQQGNELRGLYRSGGEEFAARQQAAAENMSRMRQAGEMGVEDAARTGLQDISRSVESGENFLRDVSVRDAQAAAREADIVTAAAWVRPDISSYAEAQGVVDWLQKFPLRPQDMAQAPSEVQEAFSRLGLPVPNPYGALPVRPAARPSTSLSPPSGPDTGAARLRPREDTIPDFQTQEFSQEVLPVGPMSDGIPSTIAAPRGSAETILAPTEAGTRRIPGGSRGLDTQEIPGPSTADTVNIRLPEQEYADPRTAIRMGGTFDAARERAGLRTSLTNVGEAEGYVQQGIAAAEQRAVQSIEAAQADAANLLREARAAGRASLAEIGVDLRGVQRQLRDRAQAILSSEGGSLHTRQQMAAKYMQWADEIQAYRGIVPMDRAWLLRRAVDDTLVDNTTGQVISLDSAEARAAMALRESLKEATHRAAYGVGRTFGDTLVRSEANYANGAALMSLANDAALQQINDTSLPFSLRVQAAIGRRGYAAAGENLPRVGRLPAAARRAMSSANFSGLTPGESTALSRTGRALTPDPRVPDKQLTELVRRLTEEEKDTSDR